MATKSLSLNFLWSTVIQFLWRVLLFAFPQQQKMSSTSCNHSTNKYELCFNIDSLQKRRKTDHSSAKKCFWLWRHPLHLPLTESGLLLRPDFLMCLDRQTWASTSTQRGCKLHIFPVSQVSWNPPERPRWPERHHCLGVHNSETQALSQPFVSATLALRELLSISRSKSGIPPPHPSRDLSLQWMYLPRLFPLTACLLLSSAACCLLALQSSPFVCCNYPLRRNTSPGTVADDFHSFVLAWQELARMADERWYVTVNGPSLQCSSIKHRVRPPGSELWSKLRFVTKTPWTRGLVLSKCSSFPSFLFMCLFEWGSGFASRFLKLQMQRLWE